MMIANDVERANQLLGDPKKARAVLRAVLNGYAASLVVPAMGETYHVPIESDAALIRSRHVTEIELELMSMGVP
jgi:hypothetical protein